LLSSGPAHVFAGQFDAMGIVDKTVQDRVGVSGVPEHRRTQQSSAGSYLTSQLRIRSTPCLAIGSQGIVTRMLALG
jgi:hypothetical protein